MTHPRCVDEVREGPLASSLTLPFVQWPLLLLLLLILLHLLILLDLFFLVLVVVATG